MRLEFMAKYLEILGFMVHGIIHGIMPILLCKKVISNSSRYGSLGGGTYDK
jgi:hypothetical protein